jgi:predicted DNA-binding ArsR family transcriptional regulator
MNRIKVINEPSELVPMLRAVDTKVKREVLKEVTLEWRTAKEIESKFGDEGKEAIRFFEKMKLVETKWQSTGGNYPEKSYHTYYNSFHINASWPVYEISDVLSAAMMPEEEFDELEERIVKIVGAEGKFSGDVAEKLGITSTMLKSLVKRSVRLDFRGHRIERLKD